MRQVYKAFVAAIVFSGFGLASPANAGLQIITFDLLTNSGDTRNADVGPLTDSGGSAVNGATTQFQALADYGVNKVGASATSTAVNRVATNSIASAQSTWTDRLLINSDLGGYMIIAVDVSANLSGNPSSFFPGSSRGTISYQLSAVGRDVSAYTVNYSTLHGGSSGFQGLHSAGQETVRDEGTLFSRLATFAVGFRAGQDQVRITSKLNCHAQAFVGSANCDANQSAYWGGILGVVDEDGNPIDNYLISSDSGTDYTRSFVPTAVPEPTIWAFMIIGFGTIGELLRVRRRRAVSHT